MLSCDRNALAILVLHLDEKRKVSSVETSLLSYGFLIRLINRLFHLHSNWRLKTKEDQLIDDDFDLDGYLMKCSSVVEFHIDLCPLEDWCIIDEQGEEKFDLIDIDEKRLIVVTVQSSSSTNHETFLQRATNWFHGSLQSARCLTKKDFSQMFDPISGRLINEQHFRQRIFQDGCDRSIRRLVWCYLFRVFDQSMSNDDRKNFTIRVNQRYHEMKQMWLHRDRKEILLLETTIEKDVTRTDSSVKFFAHQHSLSQSQKKLLDLLITYSFHHPDPGYVQGMTDMAAPILYVIRDEAMSYLCFCALMRHMSRLFRSDGQAIQRRLDLLRKSLRAIDYELWTKIEACDIGNLMFAYRWVLLDCKREFPFHAIFHVFETIWASLPIDRFDLHDEFFANTADQSSLDGTDSACCDLHHSSSFDSPTSLSTPIVLERWLKDFTTIDSDEVQADMFTIFLCIALLEQNRSSIMQVSSTLNVDDDDQLGFYFTRLVRQNDARQALDFARHYYRQYSTFQSRLKHFFDFC